MRPAIDIGKISYDRETSGDDFIDDLVDGDSTDYNDASGNDTIDDLVDDLIIELSTDAVRSGDRVNIPLLNFPGETNPLVWSGGGFDVDDDDTLDTAVGVDDDDDDEILALLVMDLNRTETAVDQGGHEPDTIPLDQGEIEIVFPAYDFDI